MRSHTIDTLDPRRVNRTPSPLIRMRRIHDSQEEEELRGQSLVDTRRSKCEGGRGKNTRGNTASVRGGGQEH